MSSAVDTNSQKHIFEQSQWALIRKEFRKRKLALASVYVVMLLITVSVFAPLIANNKPLYYRGINRFEFNESILTINTLVLKISRLPDEIDQEQLANARIELLAIGENLDSMGSLLEGENLNQFLPFATELMEKTRQAVEDPAARAELDELRIRMRKEIRPMSTELTVQSHFPAFASLGWADAFFMSLTILFLLLPLWRIPIRRIDPLGKKRLVPAVILIGPALFAIGWWAVVPSRLDRTDYRRGLMADASNAESAPVIYEKVTWPWVPFALDESNLAMIKQKPDLSGLYAPQVSPEEVEGTKLLPWSKPNVLGTDETGRDIFCRMIWGGRVSLSVGIVAVSIYVAIGIVVGAIAGYFRGMTDIIISRLIEVVICFPSFFLILTIVALWGPGLFKIMIIIGLTSWTGVARLVRAEFLRLSEQEFVVAGRALGYSPWRIIFRHILPNAMAPVLVSATFGIAGAILTESALSFLNLGISVPTPSWGGIMATGHQAIHSAPWLIYFPGLAIFITITAYNLIGEAFRDAADPRLRGRR